MVVGVDEHVEVEPQPADGARVAVAGADATPMTLRVQLFAMLRECAGTDALELRLPVPATVADALRVLGEHDALRGPLSRLDVVMAVNRDYAAPRTELRDGDELALIPPLSGGETVARPHVRISREPLSRERLRAAVSDPAAGAVVVFEGVTRTVPALDYEAYTEMAQERIAQILQEVLVMYRLCAIAAEHRVGEVALGEPGVIVAVSATHRAEAFAGARAAIDEIKAQVPIWKRERGGADGGPAVAGPGRTQPGRWIEGMPAPTGDGGERADTAPLTHLDRDGSARMVDVGGKPPSERVARARGRVRMSPRTARAVQAGDGPKGEVLGVARIAGIQAAKQTAQLIPLAHPLPLSFLDVRADVDVQAGVVELISEARTVASTGVEMEAMTACAIAALTIYDMVKGLERGIELEQVVLLEKRGGRSGDYRHPDC